MLVVVVGSNIMDDCQSSCRSYVFRHCRVGRHVRLSFVVWVVLSVIMSAMCWWSLSGQSSWTTVRHRVGRKFFVVVWSVVMDDCQSSCRSYVFCRVCRHGRLSVVVQSYVFGRCQVRRHGRLSFVVWVVMSVIASVICWLSLSGRSSWTTVRRRVGHMFFVESFVMDDCQTSCQSYGFR